MALVDRRKLLQTLETLGLKPSFPLIKTRPLQTPSPARLSNVAQLLGQLQNTQAMLGKLARRIALAVAPRRNPLKIIYGPCCPPCHSINLQPMKVKRTYYLYRDRTANVPHLVADA